MDEDVTRFLEDRSNLVFLNPSTMNELHLTKGSYAIIRTDEIQIMLKCWPSIAVPVYSADFPGFRSIYREYACTECCIELSRNPSFLAKCIVLKPLIYKDFMNLLDFKSFLRKQFGNFCNLKKGMVLHFCYQGYTCTFTVTEIARAVINRLHENQNSLKYVKQFKNVPFTNMDVSVLTNDKSDGSTLEKSFEDKCKVSTPRQFSKTVLSSTPVSAVKVMKSKSCKPQDQFYHLHPSTRIVIVAPIIEHRTQYKVTLRDIGGLDQEIAELNKHIKAFSQQGNQKQHVLITGSSGTGKSMIGNALKFEKYDSLHVEYFSCRNSELNITEWKKLYQVATSHAPSVVFLDDIDEVNGNTSDTKITGRHEAFLRELASGLYNKENNILFIGTTQTSMAVPQCLKKHNGFEKIIQLRTPNSNNRKIMLKKILTKFKHELNSKQVTEILDKTHGFTGGDLKNMILKAILVYNETKINNYSTLDFTFPDILTALKCIKPSSIEEFGFEKPNVKWGDIGGMENVKNIITEAVDWPLRYVEQFKHFRITPSKGILMYGPAGCCKTMIAKTLASESNLNFISVKGAEMFQKYVGESEKSVSTLFKKARSASPCILFFDEIDILAPIRGSTTGNSNVTDRILTQLLIEIDGVDILQEGVCVIAATNRPDMIDPSLLRPGRFDQTIYVPLPDSSTRKQIFQIEMSKKPNSLVKDDFDHLATITKSYTGAEITHICHEAAWFAIQEDFRSTSCTISMEHFATALKIVLPRTTQESIEFYENYKNR